MYKRKLVYIKHIKYNVKCIKVSGASVKKSVLRIAAPGGREGGNAVLQYL